MRYFAMFLMILSLGLFAVGCGQTADAPAETPSPVEDAPAETDVDAPDAPEDEGAAEGETEEKEAEKGTTE